MVPRLIRRPEKIDRLFEMRFKSNSSKSSYIPHIYICARWCFGLACPACPGCSWSPASRYDFGTPLDRGSMAVPISPECVLTQTAPNATNQIVPHGAFGRTAGGQSGGQSVDSQRTVSDGQSVLLICLLNGLLPSPIQNLQTFK